jgi:hypothetical protein
MIERADRRVLAAIRLVDDAVASRPDERCVVSGPGTWVENRSGDWVLVDHPALPTFERAFVTPDGAVASLPVVAEARPLGRRYLARRFRFSVPRTGPAMYEPVVVSMPPSPAHALRPTWTAVRAVVRWAAQGAQPAVPLEGVLVRLSVGGALRTQTLTDARGEALAISAGLLATGLDPAVPHKLTHVLDPAATEAATGRRTSLADPDDLWERRASLMLKTTSSRPLKPGEETVFSVEFPRP